MISWRLWSGAVLLMAAVSCAHARPEVAGESRAYVSPKLIACHGYNPPTFSWTRAKRVDVELKVLPNGSVESTSPRYHPAGGIRIQSDDRVVTEALSLAPGCSFEPAHVDGEAIEAWTTVSFAFH